MCGKSATNLNFELTFSEFESVDVAAWADLSVFGVLDSTVKQVVEVADPGERVTRPRVGHISFLVQLGPLCFSWLYQS